MINAITPDTLYLILPHKVSQLAVLYANQKGISTREALIHIYRSDTYRRLEDESTKLWHYGPVALLEELEENG